jgi:hypothetical protein
LVLKLVTPLDAKHLLVKYSQKVLCNPLSSSFLLRLTGVKGKERKREERRGTVAARRKSEV